MAESAPLLADIDEEPSQIVEAQSDLHDRNIPASAYFRPLFKKLAATSLVISILTIPLLIASIVIVNKLGGRYSYWWSIWSTQSLAILVNTPILLSSPALDFS